LRGLVFRVAEEATPWLRKSRERERERLRDSEVQPGDAPVTTRFAVGGVGEREGEREVEIKDQSLPSLGVETRRRL